MGKYEVKLTISQHNKIFKHRKVKLLTYYKIIDDPQKRDIEMYQYMRFPARVAVILLSPLVVFVGGVPAMVRLINECLSNKEFGADTINRHWFYKALRGERE